MRQSLVYLMVLVLLLVPVGAREFDAATTQAGVGAIDGTAQKQTKGANDWVACQVGDVLQTGDRIRTAKGSSASLVFTDQTVMRLGENTTIHLVDLSEDDSGKLIRHLEQTTGRTWSDVTPNPAQPTLFEIRGPNAVAAVKGTAFEMDAENPENTDVRCWEGSVQCSGLGAEAGEPQLIEAGQENNLFQARRGQAPRRAHFNHQEFDSFQRWNWESRQRWQGWVKSHPGRLRLHRDMLLRMNQLHMRGPQQQRVKWMENHPHPAWSPHPQTQTGTPFHPTPGAHPWWQGNRKPRTPGPTK